MPRERRSNRGLWTEASMQSAMDKVKNKELSLSEASKTFSVPKATLFRHLQGKNKIAQGCKKHLGRFEQTFDEVFESELEQYVFEMEERLFGVTNNDLRRLAFQLAERNGLHHSFNRASGLAGKKWLYGFRRRHPQITVRKPEPTSFARAAGFNKPAVNRFFNLLGSILQKHQLDGSKIYNCDETGVKTVQQQHAKVLARSGKHQVGALTSSERGKNVTVICTVNGCGSFIPPCFIFPRKRENQILMDHTPASSKGFFQESGWMTGEIFIKYLDHFMEFVKPSKQTPVLLLLDGHCSHTKSLQVLETARANGIILLSLPPHTTHRLQPLDVGFFKPLQTYYDRCIDRWLRNHPGRTFTEYQVGEAFAEAYGKAATIEIATNAFKKCGIWPFNEEVFSEADFAPSQTTDKPQPEISNSTTALSLANQSTPIESASLTTTSSQVSLQAANI